VNKIGHVGMATLLSVLSTIGPQPVFAHAVVSRLETTATALVISASWARNETATKPWLAPVGHRQPRAADVGSAAAESNDFLDQENAKIDRVISGVCVGC